MAFSVSALQPLGVIYNNTPIMTLNDMIGNEMKYIILDIYLRSQELLLGQENVTLMHECIYHSINNRMISLCRANAIIM